MCAVENRFKGMGVQRGEEFRGHAIILPPQLHSEGWQAHRESEKSVRRVGSVLVNILIIHCFL